MSAEMRRHSSSSDSAELVDVAEAASCNVGEQPSEPEDPDHGWTDVLGSQQLYRKVIIIVVVFVHDCYASRDLNHP